MAGARLTSDKVNQQLVKEIASIPNVEKHLATNIEHEELSQWWHTYSKFKYENISIKLDYRIRNKLRGKGGREYNGELVWNYYRFATPKSKYEIEVMLCRNDKSPFPNASLRIFQIPSALKETNLFDNPNDVYIANIRKFIKQEVMSELDNNKGEWFQYLQNNLPKKQIKEEEEEEEAGPANVEEYEMAQIENLPEEEELLAEEIPERTKYADRLLKGFKEHKLKNIKLNERNPLEEEAMKQKIKKERYNRILQEIQSHPISYEEKENPTVEKRKKAIHEIKPHHEYVDEIKKQYRLDKIEKTKNQVQKLSKITNNVSDVFDTIAAALKSDDRLVHIFDDKYNVIATANTKDEALDKLFKATENPDIYAAKPYAIGSTYQLVEIKKGNNGTPVIVNGVEIDQNGNAIGKNKRRPVKLQDLLDNGFSQNTLMEKLEDKQLNMKKKVHTTSLKDIKNYQKYLNKY